MFNKKFLAASNKIQSLLGQYEDVKTSFSKRLLRPLLLLVILQSAGTLGYYFVGKITDNEQATIRNCVYQSAILLTGVGFGDVLESNNSWAGTAFTVIMSIAGLGILLYIISTITGFVVGGELYGILETGKMQRQIKALQNHYIICGGGETASHIVKEMLTTNRPFVVIEIDDERIEKLKSQLGDFCHIKADASDDETLLAAGIDRAQGLYSSLPNDKDNLLIVITARQLNPNVRIISRCIELTNMNKLKKVGANSVIVPNMIGAMRMASEMVRPATVTFLDTMLRDKRAIRFEDVAVPTEHPMTGKTLAEANLPSLAEVNVIAARPSPDADFIYNPRGNLILNEGMDLILVGSPDQIRIIQDHLRSVK